jgi:Ca2+-binding RTX toxin-like protein
MSCSFAPAERSLELTVNEWGTNEAFGLEVVGSELRARHRSFAAAEAAPVPCAGGTPTVGNVDAVDVGQDRPREGITASAFELILFEGELGPGATPEATGLSEIETTFAIPGGQLWIGGTAERDRYSLGFTRRELAVNLNGDDDLDVVGGGLTGLDLSGGGGDDFLLGRRERITERPRRDIAINMFGGSGRDRLVAGGKRDQLAGGGGDDLLRGGRKAGVLQGDAGEDRLIAAPGRQLLLGGAGDDFIDARDDSRDDIDCGDGVDVAVVDRREGLIPIEDCERVRRPERRG